MNKCLSHRVFVFFFLFISILLLQSCGGGGGGSDGEENGGVNNGSGSGSAVSGDSGGSLKGRIRVQDRVEELVLSSGRYREIPAIAAWGKDQKGRSLTLPADNRDSRFLDGAFKPYSRFSVDGRYILQVQADHNCEAEDLDTLGIYCFTVFDQNYSVLGKFAKNITNYDGSGAGASLVGASLSQDGQHVAISHSFRNGKRRLSSYALNGERISAHETSKPKFLGEPVWLPDGSLVLTWDNHIVRTDPYSTLVTWTIKSLSAGKGHPSFISVSHDGKQLLFRRGKKGLWTMGVDGSNLRQVVKLSASFDGWELSAGAWSPSDAWIAFRVVLPESTPTDPGVSINDEPKSILLAVPANATNAIATNSANASQRTADVVPILSYNKNGKLTEWFFTGDTSLRYLDWAAE